MDSINAIGQKKKKKKSIQTSIVAKLVGKFDQIGQEIYTHLRLLNKNVALERLQDLVGVNMIETGCCLAKRR